MEMSDGRVLSDLINRMHLINPRWAESESRDLKNRSENKKRKQWKKSKFDEYQLGIETRRQGLLLRHLGL